jgi:hypothetical protein
MSEQPAPRRARHLMVPGEPRPRPTSSMSITTVQRWIMSTLALVTVEHLAAGIVLAAVFIDDSRPGDRIGLLVIATVLAFGGIIAFRLIHQKAPLSPWLLLATIPGTIGAWLCFWI